MTLPLVLPPTVVGFFLLILLGKNSVIGQFFNEIGLPFIFTMRGAVAAAFVVSFPLMYRSARFVDSTAEQFRADAVLKVIADVSLAHCGADRHRSRTVVFMGFSKFVHRSVDHADLRSVAVSDGNGCAFLYQVCDHFSRTFYGNLLFRGIRRKNRQIPDTRPIITNIF